MNKIILSVVAVLFFSSLSFADTCFRNSALTGFQENGRNSVVVESLHGDYQVDTFMCWDLEWADAIAFRTWGGVGTRICRGDYLLIIDQFTGRVEQRCKIQKITEVSED